MNRYIGRATYLALLFSLTLFTTIAAKADELSSLPTGDYVLDLSHASVIWKISHFGFSTYVGRFTDFSANLQLDTKEFSNSAVDVEIKVGSIATAYPWVDKEDFDKELSEDWFKSADHPTIKFVSSKVSGLEGNQATVDGELTILGVSKPVSLSVTLNKAVAAHPISRQPTLGFSATTTLDRTVWGLSKYAPGIGAEVKIEIEGEFSPKILSE